MLAARLCERGDQTVLLIEAGPDYGPLAEGGWPSDLLDGCGGSARSHDWGYWNEPRPDGTAFPLSCGQVIGGSSSVNACGLMWGRASDYDEWAAAGNSGWSFAELLPCIQRVEADQEAAGSWHGRRGAVPVSRRPEQALTPFAEALAGVAQTLGLGWLEDVNDPHVATGIGRAVRNVGGSVRWNCAFAYLDPARGRPNLRILDRSLVSRILLRGTRAYGVEAITPERRVEIEAERIIVSAGAYNSPALLLRSGIGPAHHLPDAGIAVLHDLPGVGEHLLDHPVVPMRLLASPCAARTSARLDRERRLFQWQLILRGRSSHTQDTGNLSILPMAGAAVGDGWEFLVRIEVLKPGSTGIVRLLSPDPAVPPAIHSRFFSDPDGLDASALLDGVALVRRMVARPPLRELVALERWPGRGLRGDALVAFARANAYTYHHPVGTCKMGPASDPQAVVDIRGRVHGLEGLHVADASIMPSIPAAMTNLTCMAIGERLAELLN